MWKWNPFTWELDYYQAGSSDNTYDIDRSQYGFGNTVQHVDTAANLPVDNSGGDYCIVDDEGNVYRWVNSAWTASFDPDDDGISKTTFENPIYVIPADATLITFSGEMDSGNVFPVKLPTTADIGHRLRFATNSTRQDQLFIFGMKLPYSLSRTILFENSEQRFISLSTYDVVSAAEFMYTENGWVATTGWNELFGYRADGDGWGNVIELDAAGKRYVRFSLNELQYNRFPAVGSYNGDQLYWENGAWISSYRPYGVSLNADDFPSLNNSHIGRRVSVSSSDIANTVNVAAGNLNDGNYVYVLADADFTLINTDGLLNGLDGTTGITILSQTWLQLVARNNNTYIIASSDSAIVYNDSVMFNVATTTVPMEGQMAWNSAEGTIDIGMPGGNVRQSIGQELYVPRRCKNETGSNISNGKLVYINGVSGQVPTIALADKSTEATSTKTIGMTTENIDNTKKGFVTTFGIVRELNTLAYAVGTDMWLGDDGSYSNSRPDAPDHAVYVGVVIHQHETEGEIMVNIRNGYELSELHDVKITNKEAGSLLHYDATNTYWKESTQVLLDDANAKIYSDSNGGTAKDLEIDCGSQKTVLLTRSVWKDLIISPASTVGGAASPSARAYNGSTNIISPSCFSGNTNNDVVGEVEMQHDYKVGTDWDIHVHIVPEIAMTAGQTIIFDFDYDVVGMNSSTHTTGTMRGTYTAPVGGTAAWTHIYLDLGNVSGTNRNMGDLLSFCLTRRADLDSYSGVTAFVHMKSIGVHYEIDTIGSRQELVK